MKNELNIKPILFVIISLFTVGCDITENEILTHNENQMITTIQTNANGQSYETYLPTICTNRELFALIKPDGNVYTYDMCQRELFQLTDDGQEYGSKRTGQEDSYYFFDTKVSWSSDGNRLIVGKDFTAQVINVQKATQTSTGSNVQAAIWAPDGKNIVLIETLINPRLSYDDQASNFISIIDTKNFATQLSFQGNAPVWLDNSVLFYFFPIKEAEDGLVSYDVITVNLEGQTETLYTDLETFYPVRYSRLSSNKRFIATQSQAGVLYPNLTIMNLDSYRASVVGKYTVADGFGKIWYKSNAYH